MLTWLFGGVSRSEYYDLLDLLAQKDKEIAYLVKKAESLEERIDSLERIDYEYEVEKFLDGNLNDYVKDILRDATISIE